VYKEERGGGGGGPLRERARLWPFAARGAAWLDAARAGLACPQVWTRPGPDHTGALRLLVRVGACLSQSPLILQATHPLFMPAYSGILKKARGWVYKERGGPVRVETLESSLFRIPPKPQHALALVGRGGLVPTFGHDPDPCFDTTRPHRRVTTSRKGVFLSQSPLLR